MMLMVTSQSRDLTLFFGQSFKVSRQDPPVVLLLFSRHVHSEDLLGLTGEGLLHVLLDPS